MRFWKTGAMLCVTGVLAMMTMTPVAAATRNSDPTKLKSVAAKPAAQPSEDYSGTIRVGDLPVAAGKDAAESPMGRLEAMKAAVGGEMTPAVRAAVLAAAARIQSKKTPTVGGAWKSLGPSNITRFQNGVNRARDNSGRMRTILPDPRPQKADTVYLLTSGGGLWKTTNFSASQPTWVPKTDGIYGTAGGSAAFGRSPDVLYLGSGDPFDLGVGGVMYKSTNGGDSWSAPIPLPGASAVLDVKVDTSVGSTTANDIVLVGTNAGLFRSTDGGATYNPVSVSAGDEAFFASFDFFPESWSLVKTSAGWLVSQAYWTQCPNCYNLTLVYFSADQGATWDYIQDTGALGGLDLNLSPGRTTLTAAGPNNSVVYALSSLWDGSDQQDIYRSTDGGQNFAALGVNGKTPTNPNEFNPDVNLMHGQAWYNQMVLADPADPTGNTVYAGGNYSSAVSRDGGNTWTLLTSWLGNLSASNAQAGGPGLNYQLPYAHADFHAAAVSTASGKPRIFFGSDGGIFYSDDAGKSFVDNANQGLVTALIYSLSVGPVHPDNTLIGLQDNGTLFRVNKGTYTGSIGGDGFGTGWSQANDDISMGSLYYLDINRWKANPPNNQAKYDALLNTSNLAGGAPNYPWYYDSYFITPIATPTPTADPTGHVFYTNTQHYLLKTADGGDSWNAIWTSPSASRIVRSSSHTIGLAPDSPDHIGLAGNGGTVIFTHNGGAAWSIVNVTTSLPTWPGFNATVAITSNHNVMYVGNKNELGGPTVARSADGGLTWSDATGNLDPIPVNKLVVDPSDASGNTLFAANWIGIYRTTDGGANWTRVGTGLPLAMASDIYLEPHGKFLRIASYGRGVWELALPLN